MLISGNKRLRNKVLETDDWSGKHRKCAICNKEITPEDVNNENFEYVKDKLGEHYAHSSCIKLRGE